MTKDTATDQKPSTTLAPPAAPKVQVEFVGEASSDMLSFPVAILVQGNANERQKPWFRPEFKAGQVVITDVGAIGGEGVADPEKFIVLKMERYWMVYPPRGGGSSDGPRAIKVTKFKDLEGWSSAKVEELGWKLGTQYDQKAGTYVLGQLANLGEWAKSEGEAGDTPPLATEMREFLCIGSSGTVFFIRMNARRDTEKNLKLVGTYVLQTNDVPSMFRAISITRKNEKGDVYFGLSIQKVAGAIPESLTLAAIRWQERMRGAKVAAADAPGADGAPF